jgi:hypothetical protein
MERLRSQPGDNMRTAHRRSDGAWEFSSQPFNLFTSSSDSFIDDTLARPTPVKPSLKERLLKQSARSDGRERDLWDAEGLAVPPPAYSPSASVKSFLRHL